MTGPAAPEINFRKIAVLGMGRSGIAAAAAAARLFPGADVLLSDIEDVKLEPDASLELGRAGVRVEPGRQDETQLKGCDLVIKSPGIPEQNDLVAAAKRQSIKVWGEVEFASRFLANPMVGITGTNGKTTTTKILSHILGGAGVPHHESGNVGNALSGLIGRVPASDILVVELSSFQLHDSFTLRPDVAVLLNLSEDHLDWHRDLDGYFSDKLAIFANQTATDVAIANRDDPACRQGLSDNAPAASLLWFSRRGEEAAGAAAFYRGGEIVADMALVMAARAILRERLEPALSGRIGFTGGEDSARRHGPADMPVIAWSQAALKGEHNLDNCLAATAVALSLGLGPEEIARGLRSFPGVPHRLQLVADIGGVKYVNDSKATNVDAAAKALTAFERIHVILGGSLKGCSFEPLVDAVASSDVKEILLIGEAAAEMAAAFSASHIPTVHAGDMAEAVRLASEAARPGDVVMLTPACASFDQYRNYEDRGEDFINLVNELSQGRSHAG